MGLSDTGGRLEYAAIEYAGLPVNVAVFRCCPAVIGLSIITMAFDNPAWSAKVAGDARVQAARAGGRSMPPCIANPDLPP